MTAQGIYFTQYYALLQPFVDRPDVTDVYVNRPEELWVETLGGAIECHELPGLETNVLERFARQVAALSGQGINREHPILSATLPDGARVQIVLASATRGEIALAIRKHRATELRLSDYEQAGAFASVKQAAKCGKTVTALSTLAKKGQYAELLSLAVRARCNILVAGGTSTGKTTFLNTLIKEIDAQERLILIEDAPELSVSHANMTGLVAARSALGEAIVSMDDLLNASLRMRPDRIIMGELRGPEALTFLRAINTGHPGSMTTIHANDPERAVEQIALLVLQAGTNLTYENVKHYVENSIDVFVQLDRQAGRRFVSDVRVRP